MADCVQHPRIIPTPKLDCRDVEVSCPRCTACEDVATELEVCNTREWYGRTELHFDHRHIENGLSVQHGDLVFPALP
jgi:hypothetical protein